MSILNILNLKLKEINLRQEVNHVEVMNQYKIRSLLSQDIADAEFEMKLEELSAYLPKERIEQLRKEYKSIQ